MKTGNLLAQTDVAPLLILVAVLVVGVLVLSRLLMQRRTSVWHRFARRHRLAFRTDQLGPRVEGRIDDRWFELQVDQASSDTDTLGVQVVTMRLKLHGTLPRDLGISPAIPLIGEAQRALETNTVATGDEEFDSRLIAHGASAEEVAQYLTPVRRAALLKLATEAEASETGVVENYVYVRERDVISDLAVLDRRLRALLAVAPQLDTP